MVMILCVSSPGFYHGRCVMVSACGQRLRLIPDAAWCRQGSACTIPLHIRGTHRGVGCHILVNVPTTGIISRSYACPYTPEALLPPAPQVVMHQLDTYNVEPVLF